MSDFLRGFFGHGHHDDHHERRHHERHERYSEPYREPFSQWYVWTMDNKLPLLGMIPH